MRSRKARLVYFEKIYFWGGGSYNHCIEYQLYEFYYLWRSNKKETKYTNRPDKTDQQTVLLIMYKK